MSFQKLKCKYYNSLLKRKLLISPKVIVQLDGGICSQMHQYLLGQYYARQAFAVRYDLGFYKEWGSDLNNQFVRNFDLLKAFPYLDFKEASALVVEVYRQKYYNVGNNTGKRVDDFSFLQKRPPVYLGGYYHLPANLWLEMFHSIFKMSLDILDKPNRLFCQAIDKKANSVAVHVRRGDLKVEVFDYGKPASLKYFQMAVDMFRMRFPDAYFYFFSDEPDWVSEVLLPQLSLENEGQVVDLNGSDKGYMDLFLMAHCKHQITSKGTLGKYGALLADNSAKIVVLCNDEIEYCWKELLMNPVFL